MTVAIVQLTPFLESQTFFGIPIPEWWTWQCKQAGLRATLSLDDPDDTTALRIDGRYLTLSALDIADLDEHDGVLVTPGDEELVVAAGRSSKARLGKRARGRHRTMTTDEPVPVTDLSTLAVAERTVLWRVLDDAKLRGVRVVDPSRVYLAPTVVLEQGVVLWPDVILLGNTSIGEGSQVHAGSHLTNTRVGSGCIIKPYTVAEGATLGDGVTVGPFAHLREGTVLDEGAKVGNFVETKQARLHAGAKANHLTYLGDAVVGAGANVGAGTITCNYDGARKHRTTIGAGAFIGTNSSLVAPITIGDGALVAAGSVITSDVPAGALAVGRATQVTTADKGAAILGRNRDLKDAQPRQEEAPAADTFRVFPEPPILNLEEPPEDDGTPTPEAPPSIFDLEAPPPPPPELIGLAIDPQEDEEPG